MSFCGCGHGRHNVSSASCVNSVGTAPAHERAGITREICGALPVNSYQITINWKILWRFRLGFIEIVSRLGKHSRGAVMLEKSQLLAYLAVVFCVQGSVLAVVMVVVSQANWLQPVTLPQMGCCPGVIACKLNLDRANELSLDSAVDSMDSMALNFHLVKDVAIEDVIQAVMSC